MKPSLLLAALTLALAAPTTVLAADAPAAGPFVCRVAQNAQNSNATMGSTALRCRAINLTRIRTAMQQIRRTMGHMNGTDRSATQRSLSAFSDELSLPSIPGDFDADNP